MVDTRIVEMNKFIVVDQNEYQNEYPACGTRTRRPAVIVLVQRMPWPASPAMCHPLPSV